MIRATLFLLVSTSASVLATRPFLDLRTDSQNKAGYDASAYFKFPHEIRRVAIIGAGAGGLQQASALINQGFEVRLFERKPTPGGVWTYSEKKPIQASFPYVPSSLNIYPPR